MAGGTGSRLFPCTLAVSKQLLPVYDKPMIYYPISTLIIADIKDILIITTPEEAPAFKKLLGDGSQWGISLSYTTQEKPEGVAQALTIAEDFLGGAPSCLILGDNIFYGQGLREMLNTASEEESGATIFTYHVSDARRYGVVSLDETGTPYEIIEKPTSPKSHLAVTGLYFYDATAPERAKHLTRSKRGEYEITCLNNTYLNEGTLKIKEMSIGQTWFDIGTHDSLLEAGNFISAIEKRQGRLIGDPLLCAERQEYLTKSS